MQFDKCVGVQAAAAVDMDKNLLAYLLTFLPACLPTYLPIHPT
tara:strand:- start:37 stop:165 length:129 start_codon:yes stop_codon:yes gene_type:complete